MVPWWTLLIATCIGAAIGLSLGACLGYLAEIKQRAAICRPICVINYLWGGVTMAKQINCGICAIHGNTVAMQLEQDHFKCPECDATLYDNEDGDDTFVRNWRQQQQYISRSLPEGVIIHGGEKKQGKSPGLERMKKQPLSRLDSNLYQSR